MHSLISVLEGASCMESIPMPAIYNGVIRTSGSGNSLAVSARIFFGTSSLTSNIRSSLKD